MCQPVCSKKVTVASLHHPVSAMERFEETLKALDQKASEEIARQMAMENQTKKKALDMDKFDWGRTQYADPRDPRCLEGKCRGRHTIAKFYKGSPSGQNGHALWLSCQECMLRVMYTPRWGAKGTYRSPGPLLPDIQEKLNKTEANDLHPEELGTKALGLEAAENSALRQLEKIKSEKERVAKAKAKAKTGYASTTEAVTKKLVKREHPLPAEVQEVQDGWEVTVGPNSATASQAQVIQD